MVDLLLAGAQGESDFEKALWLAATRKHDGLKYITALLRDPDFKLQFTDRVLLAQYLEGDYKSPPGRPPKERRIAYLDDTTSSAQLAARGVRDAMKERRAAGQRVWGERPKLIEQFAKEHDADPETVAGILRRG